MVEKNAAEDKAGKEAIAAPLPGPARDAFTLEPDIKVGKYNVRAACDFDLNLLSQLNSKFYSLFMKGEGGDDLPTGPSAWELCWIMTRPPREVAAYIKTHKLQGLKDAAAEEFQFLQLRDIAALVVPAVKQIVSSCATIVGHGAPETPTSGEEEANAKPNPR